MCGICGFITKFESRHEELRHSLVAMTDSLSHRGPNNSGTWTDIQNGVYLGHRRLSIIDLSEAGKQPMHSQDNRYVITFNGEIYNYKEIRSELENIKGVKFSNDTDTLVLLEACRIYGVEQALKKIEGMFAFALWDKLEKRFFLARDRVGKKPLYWGHVGKDIVFASELKAVCKFPGFHKTLSDASIASFFKYGYINSPKTIYENIFKLEPGTFLYVDEDKQPKINRYWSLDKVIAEYKLENIGFAEQQHGLELLLKDAINKRMISDVPVGVMLSGGIDSSLVTAIMQTGNSQKVKSYSIGFNEKQYDESVYAKKISEHLGTEHHEFHVEPGTAIDLLPGLPDIYDEPFADASQIPTFIVSQLLKKEVTVALSGDGGDEVFAGYSRYFWGDKFSKYNKALPYNIRLLISKLIHSVSPETLDNIFTIAPKKLRPSHSGERLHKIANILSVNSDSDIYSKLVCQWDPNTLLKNHVREENIDLSDFPGKYDIISAMQYSDFNSYLPGDILVKVDRASMANSLEIRSPLLDHRIIEYAWKLDMDSKIYNGKGKHILREILYKYVPKNLVDRPKMGFGVPISAWLRGPLKEWAFDLLSEDRIKKQGLFHSEPVLEMLNVHMSKKRNYQYPLWTMLMFQSWYDRWITDV